MKLGMTSVLCIMTVCVYQCCSRIISRDVKDYIHRTTPSFTTINVYEKDGSTEVPSPAPSTTYETYTTTGDSGEYSLTSTSPSTMEINSERAFDPQDWPTTASPNVTEIYQGMTEQSTTPPSRNNQTLPPKLATVDQHQEVLTSTQTNYYDGFYDQIGSELTTLHTIVDYNFPTTNSNTGEHVTPQQIRVQSNSQFLNGNSEHTLRPAYNQPSSIYQNDNFVFPDDLPVEHERSHRTMNSARDRPFLPETGTPLPRWELSVKRIIDAPVKQCEKGRKLDAYGICRDVARK